MLYVSRVFRAILKEVYKIAVLRAKWTVDIQLQAFQMGIILTTVLEAIAVIFWQTKNLAADCHVLNTCLRQTFKLMD